MISQEYLADRLRQRLQAAGCVSAQAGDWAAIEIELQQRTPELCGYLVLRAFDLETYCKTTLMFLARQTPDRLEQWQKSFTWTAFLAGNPRHLSAFTFAAVAPGGTLGWALLADARTRTQLERLLKRLKTAQPVNLPPKVHLSGSGEGSRKVRICLAIADLRLEEYLVHLNHLVCEAFIAGQLRAEDAIELVHVARIDALEHEPAQLRIHRDPTREKTLQLQGYLDVVPAGK